MVKREIGIGGVASQFGSLDLDKSKFSILKGLERDDLVKVSIDDIIDEANERISKREILFDKCFDVTVGRLRFVGDIKLEHAMSYISNAYGKLDFYVDKRTSEKKPLMLVITDNIPKIMMPSLPVQKIVYRGEFNGHMFEFKPCGMYEFFNIKNLKQDGRGFDVSECGWGEYNHAVLRRSVTERVGGDIISLAEYNME